MPYKATLNKMDDIQWYQATTKTYQSQTMCTVFEDVLCNNMGLYSLSGRTTYHKISWSLEAARFGFWLFLSLWNLLGTSAAAHRQGLIHVLGTWKYHQSTSKRHDIERVFIHNVKVSVCPGDMSRMVWTGTNSCPGDMKVSSVSIQAPWNTGSLIENIKVSVCPTDLSRIDGMNTE